jgi:hypothetical protein
MVAELKGELHHEMSLNAQLSEELDHLKKPAA